jgi:shikimate kinase
MSRLVLIGAPGAGKSTVGKALSEKLNREFLDTDALIQDSTGKTITDIFVVDGEEVFRAIELEVLADVLKSENTVISLGGGAPISEQAQTLITDSQSLVIFLDVSLATAAPRVGFNRDRPLLLGNPRAQWQALSDMRRPVYERLADVVIKVDEMDVDAIVTAIVKEVK